jgi:disulfide bond formation protein DsbB
MSNFQLIRKNSEYFLIIISFCILISTLLIEYVFDFPPCKLCIYQRIPYVLIIILGITLVFLGKKKEFLFSFIVLQIVNFVIASFHSLVERGVVEYEMNCTSTGADIQTIEELRIFLEKVPITKCNEILFSIMGLSLANFNLIVSILLIIWTCDILKLDEQK